LTIGFKIFIIASSSPELSKNTAFLILIKFKFSLSIELIDKIISKKSNIFKRSASKLLSIIKYKANGE
jgi:hypothetical protein